MISLERSMLSALVLVTLAFSLPHDNASEVKSESELSGVDISNLLLEYNPDEGPNKTVTVELSTYMTHASWSSQKLKAVFYFRQKWRDHRLAFNSGKDVQIPSRHKLWEPDTFLSNSIKTSTSGDSFIRLSSDGTVFKSVKMSSTVPCPTTVAYLVANDGVVDCSLNIESYGFSGVSLIRYEWKEQGAIEFNDKTNVKEMSKSTSEVTTSSGIYPRASVGLKMQTALTKQVLDYITLDKSDL